MRNRLMKWGIVFSVALLLVGSFLAVAEAERFEGIKIRFFCGGPPGCPFASVVYRGAKAAEEDLGPTVEYVFSDWEIVSRILCQNTYSFFSPFLIPLIPHVEEFLLHQREVW